MAEITIDAFQFAPDTSFTGTTCELRLWYAQSFIDSTGVPVSRGTATTGFRITVDCTIVSGVVHVPSFVVWSTLDAISQSPQSIQINAVFYSARGSSTGINPFAQIDTPASWVVPNPTPLTTMTFEQWTIYNATTVLANAPQTFWTAAQTQAYFDSLDPAPDASDVTKGITKLDVAPDSATNPVAVGINSPLIGANVPLLISTGYSGNGSAAVRRLLVESGGDAAIAAITDTGGVIGVGVRGSSGSVTFAQAGYVALDFEGVFNDQSNVGDYVTISSVSAGRGHAAGPTYPTSGQIIGRIIAVSLGEVVGFIELFGAEVRGGSGTLSGAVALTGIISPTQLAANTNNWNPTGLSTASTVRLSTDAARNLTGIAGGSTGRLLVLQNVGTFPLILAHDTTSTAANRFYCPNGVDVTLPRYGEVELNYDSTSSRWRVGKVSSSSPVQVNNYASGGIGTSASPWTGWDTTITWAANTSYYFPSGYYSYATSPNFGLANIRMYGDGIGATVFKFTGSGIALKFDDNVGTTFGMSLADFSVRGNAAATTGLYLRSMHHLSIQNIEARDVTGACLETHFSVLGVLDNFRVSANEGAFATTPTNGIKFGKRNAGEPTTAWTIITPTIEHVSGDGIVCSDLNTSVFLSGTSEGNGGRGILLDTNSTENTIIGMDCEVNTGDDFTDNGTNNQFINCLSTAAGGGSGMFRANTSTNTLIQGGRYNKIRFEVGATAPSARNLRFNNDGGGSFFNAPTDSDLYALYNVTVGAWFVRSGTVTVYDEAGSPRDGSHTVANSVIIGGGGTVTVTLAGAAAFTSAGSYAVTTTDVTGANVTSAAAISGTQFTITGTAGHTVYYIATGN